MKKTLITIAEASLVAAIVLALYAVIKTPDPMSQRTEALPAPSAQGALLPRPPGYGPSSLAATTLRPRSYADALPSLSAPRPSVAPPVPADILADLAEITAQKPADFAAGLNITEEESKAIYDISAEFSTGVLSWDHMQERMIALLGKERADQYNEAAILEGIRLTEAFTDKQNRRENQ